MFEIDFKFVEPFELGSGEILSSFELRASVYGKLNADKSNAVLVFHALTGSSRIGDWWEGVIGEGKGLDTSKYAFVCVNYLGSCYGSTSGKLLKKKGLELQKSASACHRARYCPHQCSFDGFFGNQKNFRLWSAAASAECWRYNLGRSFLI
ncbi:MAG: hypothetical protein HC846_11260 [Blastocatellia bacterium]|nr:hypothetical protein [Blastocatellia bacterium]